MNQIEEETGGAIVKIVIGNKSPPIYNYNLKNCSRQSLGELIAVIESVKLKLIEKYNQLENKLEKEK